MPREGGETTVGRVSFTPDQKLLIISLCEDFLRRSGAGQGQIPNSAAAANRNRKSRLVEHALSTRMVTEDDRALLDDPVSPR